jgi:hypothetical protein
MLIQTARDQVQKPFLGTECEKQIYKPVRELRSGAWFESQRITATGWGDRLKKSERRF